MTKYDYFKQQIEEREKRIANIAEIDRQLKEARNLLQVLHGQPQGFETARNLNTVRHEIKRLEAFKADEQTAYCRTFEAAPADIEKAVEKINL